MKNFLTRTATGLLFLVVMVGCILFSPYSYAALMLFIMVVMMYEFYRMTLGRGKCLQKTLGILAGVAAWLASFMIAGPLSEQTFSLVIALPMLAFACWITLLVQQLYQHSEKPFELIAYTLLGFFYIVVPLMILNFVAYINFPMSYSTYNGTLLLALFIILWCSDVGAYCFGMLFGRHGKHKLFPSVSPKKSWEGYFGGLLMALAAGYVMSLVGFLSFGIVHALVMAALIHVFGVFGDLIESMLKRSVGVKDSGKIMPGHGGLLDRFDAALVAFPVACLYLLIIQYI